MNIVRGICGIIVILDARFNFIDYIWADRLFCVSVKFMNIIETVLGGSTVAVISHSVGCCMGLIKTSV